MELDLGTKVRSGHHTVGTICDLVLEPATLRVTHIAVEPHHRHRRAHLVPIRAIERADGDTVDLRWTKHQVDAAPPLVRTEVVIDDGRLRCGMPRVITAGSWPIFSGDPRIAATPAFTATSVGRRSRGPSIVTTRIEHVPDGTVELCRTSEVTSSDGHVIGHVLGAVTDDRGDLQRLVVRRGHHVRGHAIDLDVADIDAIGWDAVRLTISRDHVDGAPRHHGERHDERHDEGDGDGDGRRPSGSHRHYHRTR